MTTTTRLQCPQRCTQCLFGLMALITAVFIITISNWPYVAVSQNTKLTSFRSHIHNLQSFLAAKTIFISPDTNKSLNSKGNKSPGYSNVVTLKFNESLIREGKSNVYKFFSSQRDLFEKSINFNSKIIAEIENDVKAALTKPCKQISVMVKQRHKVVRGYVPINWKRVLGGSMSVLGTKYWADVNAATGSKAFRVTKPLGTNTTEKTLPKYKQYNFRMSTSGVKTFILSALENENAKYIDVQTRTNNYYHCYEAQRLRSEGGWLKQAGAMYPALCHNECSDRISVLTEPVSLPDYALHTDYTSAAFRTSCANHRIPFQHSGDISLRVLHDAATADILQTMDVVFVGGVVFQAGHVLTSRNEGFDLYHCMFQSTNIIGQYRKIKNVTAVKCTPEVFVMSDYADDNFFHVAIDQMQRMAGYVPLLQRRPQIALHVGARAVKFIKMFMQVFGLRNSIVTGVVKANVIYIPHAGGCHNPNFMYTQLTNTYFTRYVERNRQLGIGYKQDKSNSRRLIVLIKRKKRPLVNFNATYELLTQLAQDTNHELVAFDDLNLPSFNETLDIFNRAALVVGPHGAALANLLAGTPGATVVEIHCKSTANVRLCFRLLALRLGMRYFGTQTTRPKAMSARCNREGVSVDLNELKIFLKTAATYLSKS